MFRAYPSLFLLLMMAAGVGWADAVILPLWIYIVIGAVAAVAGTWWAFRGASRRAVLFLGAAMLTYAAMHYTLRYYPHGNSHVARLAGDGKRYHIYATITDWPELGSDMTQLKARVDSLAGEVTSPSRGAVLVRIADSTTSLQRGDRLEFYGRIQPLRGRSLGAGFDYRRFLNLKGVHGVVYLTNLLDARIVRRHRYGVMAVVDSMRDYILQCFHRNLSPPAAALAAGFLIGETRHIPPEIYRWFRDSGTLHLLAVSGSNVALVLGFFVFMLRPLSLSRRTRSAVLLLVLVIFAMLSYGEPSVLRASVMAALVIAARWLGRRIDLNNIVGMAAVIMLLIDPTQLFDVGFQLSFVTAWGLIAIVPVVHKLFPRYHGRRWYRWAVLPLIVSLVAQVCSMPLVALYFHRVPAISVVANLVIVPLTSLAVMGALGIVMANMILPELGLMVGSIVNGLMRGELSLLRFFGGELTPIITTGTFSGWWVLVFYTLLALAVLSVRYRAARRLVVIATAVLVNLALAESVIGKIFPSENTRICMVSVPGGIAVVVRPPPPAPGVMLLSGLHDRDYPTDERILIPLLRAAGIARLSALVVMSADYGVLDDVLRTADTMATPVVYIPRQLLGRVRDVTRFRLGDTIGVEIRTFDGADTTRADQGVFLAASQVTVALKDTHLRLVRGASTGAPARCLPQKKRVLVWDGKADISAPPWLAGAGYDMIVCSEVTQPSGVPSTQPTAARPVGGREVVDLKRVGWVCRESPGK